jgi:hypothetical protein
MVLLLVSIGKPKEAWIPIMDSCLEPIGFSLLVQMQSDEERARTFIAERLLQKMKDLLAALRLIGPQCPRPDIEKARLFEEDFEMGPSNQLQVHPQTKDK